MARSELSKQRDRISHGIKRLRERGYYITSETEYDLLYNLSLDEMKSVTPQIILKLSEEYKPSEEIKEYLRSEKHQATDTFLPTEGKDLESEFKKFKTKSKKGFRQTQKPYNEYEETADRGKIILDEIRERIYNFNYSDIYAGAKHYNPNTKVTRYYVEEYKYKHAYLLSQVLDAAIENEGEDVVAERLQKNAQAISELSNIILYGSGGENGDQKINNRIVEFAEILKGSPLDIDENEELTDLSEMLDIY